MSRRPLEKRRAKDNLYVLFIYNTHGGLKGRSKFRINGTLTPGKEVTAVRDNASRFTINVRINRVEGKNVHATRIKS